MSDPYGPVEWSTRLFDLPRSAVVTADRGRVRLKVVSPRRPRLLVAQALAVAAVFAVGIFPETVALWVESALGTAAAAGYREYWKIFATVATIATAALPLHRRRARAAAESVTAADVAADPDASVEPHAISDVTLEGRRSMLGEKARLSISMPDGTYRLVGPKSDLEDLRDRIDVRETRSGECQDRESITGDAVELAEN
mgnify:FL=1|jgi:hypothetical protein